MLVENKRKDRVLKKMKKHFVIMKDENIFLKTALTKRFVAELS